MERIKMTRHYLQMKRLKSIPKSYKPTPRGRQRAEKVESDRADKGHHPNYTKGK